MRLIRLGFLWALWPNLSFPQDFPARVEGEAAQVVDLFYDLQFDKALEAAARMEEQHSGHPAGPFYKSVAYYQRYLLESPPSTGALQSFQEESRRAFRLAVAISSMAPAASEYYQGAALGFDARVLVAQRRYAAAIPKGRRAVAHLRKAQKLDPSMEDINLGLGMYYYFADRMPAAAKPFAYLMIGMWGDREKGLALLERTAEKGQAARMEAKSVLAAIYASEMEKRWDEALLLFKELMERYPHNPRYRFSLVYVLQREGFWDTSAEIADPEGKWIQELDPAWRSVAQATTRYRAAENHLFAGRWPEAVIQLDRLESEEVPERLRDWVALRRGNALDAQGRSADAASFYSLIEGKKARGLAEIFLKTPFPEGPRDVFPNRWPLPLIPD